jgi:hypothetical protein
MCYHNKAATTLLICKMTLMRKAVCIWATCIYITIEFKPEQHSQSVQFLHVLGLQHFTM